MAIVKTIFGREREKPPVLRGTVKGSYSNRVERACNHIRLNKITKEEDLQLVCDEYDVKLSRIIKILFNH
jgi:hypothetical protein